MKNYALVDDGGKVVNTLMWDGESEWQPPEGMQVVEVAEGQHVSIGFSYDGAAFVAPPAAAEPVSIPQSVTMRQARLALLAAGKLPAVNAAIVSLPSPQMEAAQIEWEFAATVDRGSAFVQSLSAALALSDADLDALFTHAATL